MQVSNTTKNAYHSNSTHKELKLTFPDLNLTVPHKQIYSESMRLKESIFDGDSIEFVGCISSVFNIQVYGIEEELKNEKIVVSIIAEDTEEIPLFCGYVDSVTLQSNKNYKKITAYDDLYTKANVNVAEWYETLSFPITLFDLRTNLFRFINIEQVPISLPNDGVMIEKQYAPKTLNALNVIKAICQINGAFGIMNRHGKFEYRILAENIVGNVYPSVSLFPAANLFPSNPEVAMAKVQRMAESVKAEVFSFYRSVDFEEYEVKPVDKVTIRQSEDDDGITYGNGINNYIIQGNIFTYGLSEEVLIEIAQKIYNNVKNISYRPFSSQNNGLPFIECGLDAVAYYVTDPTGQSTVRALADGEESNARTFYIFSRELSGIQALTDSYDAEGEEYQTEFLTDLQMQVDLLKRGEATKDYISDYTYDKATIDEMAFGSGGGFGVMSVDSLPATISENIIYLIRGEIVVI